MYVLVVSVCRRGVGCPALTGFAVLWLSCDPAHVCSSSAHTPPRVPRASAAAPRNPHRRLATNTAASARARPAPAAVTMTYRRCFTAVTNQCFCIAGRADRTVRRRVLRPLRPVALPQRAGWFVPSCASSTALLLGQPPAHPRRPIALFQRAALDRRVQGHPRIRGEPRHAQGDGAEDCEEGQGVHGQAVKERVRGAGNVGACLVFQY